MMGDHEVIIRKDLMGRIAVNVMRATTVVDRNRVFTQDQPE
jgi:hypothetical protein